MLLPGLGGEGKSWQFPSPGEGSAGGLVLTPLSSRSDSWAAWVAMLTPLRAHLRCLFSLLLTKWGAKCSPCPVLGSPGVLERSRTGMSWDPAGTARPEEHRSRVCESPGGRIAGAACFSLVITGSCLSSQRSAVCWAAWYPFCGSRQVEANNRKFRFFVCLSFRGLKLLLVQHLPRRAASYSLGTLKPTLQLPSWAEAGAGLQNAARGLPGDTWRTSYWTLPLKGQCASLSSAKVCPFLLQVLRELEWDKNIKQVLAQLFVNLRELPDSTAPHISSFPCKYSPELREKWSTQK